MATAAILGFDAQVYVSNDGGTTYLKFAEAREMTLNVEDELIDATSHDSAAWREFINGLRNWTVDLEGLYISTDATQNNIFTAITAKTLLKVQFRVKDTSGEDQFSGDVRVSTFVPTMPNDDAAASTVNLQGTGALTKGSVA